MSSAPELSVVEVLSRTLERAKAGDISGIAIAVCHADLCTASAWSMEAATLAELIGSVEMLKFRLLEQMKQGRRDEDG